MYCRHEWVDRTEILRKVFWEGYTYWVCRLCMRIKWEVNDNE